MKVKDDLETWLDLWAQHCRNPGANQGYPKQVPWYTEPKKYADEPSPEDNIWFDHIMADKIESAIIPVIQRREPFLIECLRAYFGAYPGVVGKRSARVNALAMKSDNPPREIYRNVDIAKQQITGALDHLSQRG